MSVSSEEEKTSKKDEISQLQQDIPDHRDDSTREMEVEDSSYSTLYDRRPITSVPKRTVFPQKLPCC